MTNDHSDAIAQITEKGTNGCNYDIETEDIIKWLKSWQKKCSFTISEVESDGFTMTLATLPKDMTEFCKSVYEICPDTIDQHYGCFKDMIECSEGDEIPDELKELIDGIDLESDDYGIKIMERDILKKKVVGFWWD